MSAQDGYQPRAALARDEATSVLDEGAVRGLEARGLAVVWREDVAVLEAAWRWVERQSEIMRAVQAGQPVYQGDDDAELSDLSRAVIKACDR